MESFKYEIESLKGGLSESSIKPLQLGKKLLNAMIIQHINNEKENKISYDKKSLYSRQNELKRNSIKNDFIRRNSDFTQLKQFLLSKRVSLESNSSAEGSSINMLNRSYHRDFYNQNDITEKFRNKKDYKQIIESRSNSSKSLRLIYNSNNRNDSEMFDKDSQISFKNNTNVIKPSPKKFLFPVGVVNEFTNNLGYFSGFSGGTSKNASGLGYASSNSNRTNLNLMSFMSTSKNRSSNEMNIKIKDSKDSKELKENKEINEFNDIKEDINKSSSLEIKLKSKMINNLNSDKIEDKIKNNTVLSLNKSSECILKESKVSSSNENNNCEKLKTVNDDKIDYLKENKNENINNTKIIVNKDKCKLKKLNKADNKETRSIFKFKNLYDSLDEEDFLPEFNKEIYNIHPDDEILMLWNNFYTLYIFIVIIIFSIKLAFISTRSRTYLSLILEYIFVDVIIIINFVLKLLTGISYNHSVSYSLFKIIINDFFSYVLTLIVLLPIGLLKIVYFSRLIKLNQLISTSYNTEFMTHSDQLNFIYTENFSYFLKLILIYEYFGWANINSIYENSINMLEFINRCMTEKSFLRFLINYYDSIHKYLKFILLFFMIVNINSCLYIFIGLSNSDYFSYLSTNRMSWIDNNDRENIFKLYIDSFYFVMSTFLSVGYGDIISYNFYEKLFNIYLLFSGCLFYSFMITTISSQFKITTKSRKTYEKKLVHFEEIVNNNEIPDNLKERINKFLHFEFKVAKLEKIHIFNNLPSILRNELIFSMYYLRVKNLNFFQIQNRKVNKILSMNKEINENETIKIEEFISYVIPLLNSSSYQKDEIIMEANQLIDEMIMIYKGKLDICLGINYRNYKLATLKKNNHFGEVLMFYENETCPYNLIVTSKLCEIFTLKKDHFYDLIERYSFYINNILENGVKWHVELENTRQIAIKYFNINLNFKGFKRLLHDIKLFELREYIYNQEEFSSTKFDQDNSFETIIEDNESVTETIKKSSSNNRNSQFSKISQNELIERNKTKTNSSNKISKSSNKNKSSSTFSNINLMKSNSHTIKNNCFDSEIKEKKSSKLRKSAVLEKKSLFSTKLKDFNSNDRNENFSNINKIRDIDIEKESDIFDNNYSKIDKIDMIKKRLSKNDLSYFKDKDNDEKYNFNILKNINPRHQISVTELLSVNELSKNKSKKNLDKVKKEVNKKIHREENKFINRKLSSNLISNNSLYKNIKKNYGIGIIDHNFSDELSDINENDELKIPNNNRKKMSEFSKNINRNNRNSQILYKPTIKTNGRLAYTSMKNVLKKKYVTFRENHKAKINLKSSSKLNKKDSIFESISEIKYKYKNDDSDLSIKKRSNSIFNQKIMYEYEPEIIEDSFLDKNDAFLKKRNTIKKNIDNIIKARTLRENFSNIRKNKYFDESIDATLETLISNKKVKKQTSKKNIEDLFNKVNSSSFDSDDTNFIRRENIKKAKENQIENLKNRINKKTGGFKREEINNENDEIEERNYFSKKRKKMSSILNVNYLRTQKSKQFKEDIFNVVENISSKIKHDNKSDPSSFSGNFERNSNSFIEEPSPFIFINYSNQINSAKEVSQPNKISHNGNNIKVAMSNDNIYPNIIINSVDNNLNEKSKNINTSDGIISLNIDNQLQELDKNNIKTKIQSQTMFCEFMRQKSIRLSKRKSSDHSNNIDINSNKENLEIPTLKYYSQSRNASQNNTIQSKKSKKSKNSFDNFNNKQLTSSSNNSNNEVKRFFKPQKSLINDNIFNKRKSENIGKSYKDRDFNLSNERVDKKIKKSPTFLYNEPRYKHKINQQINKLIDDHNIKRKSVTKEKNSHLITKSAHNLDSFKYDSFNSPMNLDRIKPIKDNKSENKFAKKSKDKIDIFKKYYETIDIKDKEKNLLKDLNERIKQSAELKDEKYLNQQVKKFIVDSSNQQVKSISRNKDKGRRNINSKNNNHMNYQTKEEINKGIINKLDKLNFVLQNIPYV